jgi:hypothetical protein
MAELWFSLSRSDQAEALEVAAARTGRPAHLLEKDIWVVWALSAIYSSSLASKLTFKGGTSLSKVYKIIDRFSEDLDLTYDTRISFMNELANIESTARCQISNRWLEKLAGASSLFFWLGARCPFPQEQILSELRRELTWSHLNP